MARRRQILPPQQKIQKNTGRVEIKPGVAIPGQCRRVEQRGADFGRPGPGGAQNGVDALPVCLLQQFLGGADFEPG